MGLKLFFRKAMPPGSEAKRSRIMVGAKSPGELVQALKDRGFYVGPTAVTNLKELKFGNKRKEIELVQLTVHELGFPEGANIWRVAQEVRILGGRLCGLSDAAEASLQDQGCLDPEEALFLTVRAGKGGCCYGFCVRNIREGKAQFRGVKSEPNYFLRADWTVVFRPPELKKKK